MSRLSIISLSLASILFCMDSASVLESSLRILDGTSNKQDSIRIYSYDRERFSRYKVDSSNGDIGVIFNGLRGLDEGVSFLYGINHDTAGTVTAITDSSSISGSNRTHFNIAYKKGAECYFLWVDEQGLASNIPLKTSSAPDGIVVGTESGTISGQGYHDIYFIVSSHRLEELENLLYKHSRIQKANPSAAVRITDQIRQMLDGYIDPGKGRRYANRLEKAVELGMSYRGDDDDAVRVSSMTEIVNGNNDLAIKRITIEYR